MDRLEHIERIMEKLAISQAQTDAQIARTEAQIAETDAHLRASDEGTANIFLQIILECLFNSMRPLHESYFTIILR